MFLTSDFAFYMLKVMVLHKRPYASNKYKANIHVKVFYDFLLTWFSTLKYDFTQQQKNNYGRINYEFL